MKHQEQFGVHQDQDHQAQYDTMSRLLNLLRLGGLDRKAVHRMRASSLADVHNANESLAASKAGATAALDELQAHKEKVFDDKVKPFVNAYSLIDVDGASEFRLESESSTLTAGIFPPSLPGLASSGPRIATGFMLGAAVGGLAAYGVAVAGVVSGAAVQAVLIAMCLVPGLLSAMRAGCKQAAQMRTAEQHVCQTTLEYVSDVEQRVRILNKIPSDVAAMKARIDSITQRLCIAEEFLLDPVLGDASNACKLLVDILDTALLDGEGALMTNVIEKLHRQQTQVQGMRDKLAA
jgi:hypothetical protein